MKRLEQIAAIFIAAGLAIPSYWFFWTLAGGGGYEKRTKQVETISGNPLQTSSDLNQP
tara:strand:- start:95 stop:268 length:174 start_codon:yes stop_codon:yes gene_type:complete